MKKFFLSASLGLFLISCSAKSPAHSVSRAQLLRNPLFAERYGDELSERMTNIEILHDPLIKDERKKGEIDRANAQGVQMGQEASRKRREGTSGDFIPAAEDVQGQVLYVDNTLYIGSTFFTVPGPDLHLYLTTLVDPRDGTFPDPTSIDLGQLESPYGLQSYAVSHQGNPLLLRTAVLWDASLGRLYGFAQLNK